MDEGYTTMAEMLNNGSFQHARITNTNRALDNQPPLVNNGDGGRRKMRSKHHEQSHQN